MIACFAIPHLGLGVERARGEDARGTPLGLVLPDNVLAVVSTDAAPFGVHAGQSASGARVLCPELRVLPYDRESYEQAARPVWDLFATESSVVEPVSPEICYVELSGRTFRERAEYLVTASAALCGATVHAGLARTKFVAREAARQATAGTVVPVAIGYEAAFLTPIPVRHLPGLDKILSSRLDRLGIHTLGDLQQLSPHDLHRQFRGLSYRLHRLAMGEDGERVRARWPPRAIEEALAFEYEIIDTRQIHEALRRCADSISVRLVNAREYARFLSLSVSLADGNGLDQQEKQALPISSAELIHRVALRLFNRMAIIQPVSGVRLVASEIDAASGRQLALLDLNGSGVGLPHERQEALKGTLHYLGNRYGSQSVQLAKAYHQPRKISLWTDTLGRVIDKPLDVVTDKGGTPMAFYWNGHKQQVEQVLDRWREDDWSGNGTRSRRTVYLVQTAACPFSELIQSGESWKLGRRFD